MKQLKKNRKGFSLTEVLVAVLIMAMVTTVVATGIPGAVQSYKQAVDSANAQMLLTTMTNSLRNELDMASEMSVTTDSNAKTLSISYTDSGGSQSRITFANGAASSDGVGVTLEEYINYNSDVTGKTGNKDGFSRPLVAKASATNGMQVKVDGIVFDPQNNYIQFTNLRVVKGDTVLAKVDTYTVKTEN